MKNNHASLRLRRLGIDTYKDPVIFVRHDCHVCRSEGLTAPARVHVALGARFVIATLNVVNSNLIECGDAGLSEYAWSKLDAYEGAEVIISHADHVDSLSYVRSKIYGNTLSKKELKAIISDITVGKYSNIYISSFLTACAGGRMKQAEIINLTKAMIEVGDTLSWKSKIIVDKHCVGGLPGNRTTPIIVSIVAAFGLTMPKTSSRAITSPAGTADTMEILAPVDLSAAAMKEVVDKEQGCIVWGGSLSLNLSPADEILIRVEKVLNLDSEGQLIASILSKKIAAGATHILIDIPIGPTAKVRSIKMADTLKSYLEATAARLGVTLKVIISEGVEPIGRGIGPALEARDIVAVLTGDINAPQDLRKKALMLAGNIIEFSPQVKAGDGIAIATEILKSGKAWDKFKAICRAQGGLREIPVAKYQHDYKAKLSGVLESIDNRHIALIAKLAGAPMDKTAGVDLHIPIGTKVNKGDVIFTIHTNSQGALAYALDHLSVRNEVVQIRD